MSRLFAMLELVQLAMAGAFSFGAETLECN
jgi:hypothetical protein